MPRTKRGKGWGSVLGSAIDQLFGGSKPGPKTVTVHRRGKRPYRRSPPLRGGGYQAAGPNLIMSGMMQDIPRVSKRKKLPSMHGSVLA